MKIYINEQPLADRGSWSVETEQIDVTPAQTIKPDMGWSHVDRNGHYHAFSDRESDQLPTLKRENIEHQHNEDEGDGYVETWTSIEIVYRCRICNDRVEPRWNAYHSTHRVTAPGRMSWQVEVRGTGSNAEALHALDDHMVSVRVEDSGNVIFGVGLLKGVGASGVSPDQPLRWIGYVYGNGPFGTRKGNEA